MKNGDLSDINKVLILDPNNSEAYGMRGTIEFREGNFEKALADLNKSVELDPTNASKYFSRGNAKFIMKDIPGAISDLNKAIELDPTIAEYYYNRAMFGLDQLIVSMENLIQDFTKAIALKKDYGEAYYGRAIVKYRSGDKAGACSDAQMAVKLNVDAAKEKIVDFCAP